MTFFSFCVLPCHTSNLPPVTLAKHEVQVEQVCCQVRWGVWAHGSLAAEAFPKFPRGKKMCAFSTVWPILDVDLSFSEVCIWFGGTKWTSGRKLWFQADFSLTPGTWSGIMAAWWSQTLLPSIHPLPTHPCAPVCEHSWVAQHKMNDYSYRERDLSNHLRKNYYEDTAELDSKLGRWEIPRQF